MKDSDIPAVILAGGKGTRLQSVLPNTPKSLVQINGIPFITILVNKLKQAGINHIIFLTGYMHDLIQNYCGNGQKFGLNIEYSRENSPLGTGGALANAGGLLNKCKSFLLINGDVYCDSGFEQISKYQLDSNELGVISVSKVKDTSRFGSIMFNQNNPYIKEFSEKNHKGIGYVNAGIYKLSSTILKYIPKNKFASLEKDIFPKLIQKKHHFKALPLDTRFFDIGTIGSLEEFREYYSKLESISNTAIKPKQLIEQSL